MTAQQAPRNPLLRWKTQRGLASIIIFLIIAFIIEYVVVVYAMSLGVQEKPENKIFGFISPMFHLVPLTVVVALFFSWVYLTRQVTIKPKDMGKMGFASKQRKENRIKQFFGKVKAKLLKATVESALTIIITFAIFILLISVLAYPSLIFLTITNAYKSSPSFLGFINGTAEAFASVGGIFSGLNGAIVAAAPGFRDSVLSLGAVIRPLINLDNAGKYLFFQNAAAWISAFIVLFYGEFVRKSPRYRRIRKS